MNELDVIRTLGSSESLGPEAEAAALRRLRALIQPEPVPLLRRGGRRRAATIGAVAATLTMLIASAVMWVVPPPPARAAVLTRLASTAEARPFEPVKPGQYVYTKSLGGGSATAVDVVSGESRTYPTSGTREAWIGPDGSGRIIDAGTDQLFGPGELTFLDLSDLPGDASALLRVIEAREVLEGPPGNAETFYILVDLLRETAAPPEVRAALFRAAGRLPGVEEMTLAIDQVGRRGVGVAFTHDGLRTELIFDPETSLPLGERLSRVTDSGGMEVESWIAYLGTGVVDSTSETP
jgi:hypothetical protein